MPTTKSLYKEVWIDKHLVRWVTDIMVLINVGLSMAILAGGPHRFTIPSYSPLITYVHGFTWIWSIWIGVAAFLMVVPFRVANIIGLWLSMFWHIVWSACFTVAVTRYDTAAATPIPVYGGLAMVSAALLLARAITITED